MTGDVATQLRAIDEGALVRALPDFGTLEVTGPERQSWLAGLVTQDLSDLKPGQGCYALHVTKNGRIMAELWVLLAEERILIGTQRERLDTLQPAMDRYLIMEDAELLVPEQRYGWWLAHGPKASAVAEAARGVGADAALGRLGELDTAIIASREPDVPNLAETLTSVQGAVLATPDGWERVRIERMIPRWGVDFEADCYPQEACLEHLAVSFNKGCYVGQEAVFMLEKRGHVKKRLVRLVMDGEGEIAPGDGVTTPDGEEVGKVTSTIHADGKTWAMGLVRYKQTLSGTELRVGDHTAKVSCLAVREGGPRC
jgi:folate-binding protein YgfZ